MQTRREKTPSPLDLLALIIGIGLVVASVLAFGECVGGCLRQTYRTISSEEQSALSVSVQRKSPYAVLVSTNVVSQPCPCGLCDNARGIRVPEHVGVIGYDLRIVVSTNYLPVLYLP